MKFASLALLMGLTTGVAFAQQPAGYQITLDLQQVANDRIKVVVQPPTLTENQATYIMPSVIPGSYSRKDYGRFVSGFTALDAKGRKLKVKHPSPNLFVIDNARTLARLEYYVDDTWDARQDDNFIFQPGGTNFEAGRDFVLNHYGLYGYFDGQKMMPYQLTVRKPADLYGATALPKQSPSATEDVYTAPSYVTLSDGPILYSRPDTASFAAGGARIGVSVVSESGVVKAAQIQEIMRPMAEALAQYFGGEMPVEHYEFLLYFPGLNSPLNSKNGGYGAMEHSYSSVYFLPEIPDPDRVKSMVQEVASHEFLHMLAPLNIHSREIGEFDFRDPQMSQHLWLYEGVTEYIAQLVQVRGGLNTPDEFRQHIKQKIDNAEKYPNVSFTTMSRQILDAPYKDMYQNVYEKGALIGFLLDIRLQELSQGRQSLRDVLLTLRQKYGPTRSFEDKDLIPEFVSLTNPQMQDFFDRYVIGNEPLPYAEYFQKIGWHYAATEEGKTLAFGNIGFNYDSAREQFKAAQTKAAENAFGLEEGDIIVAVNNQSVTMANAEQLLRPLVEPTSAEPVTVRFQASAAVKPKERTATPRTFDVKLHNVLRVDPAATPAQMALRAQVLKPLSH
ncbi:peptidase M61 [Hymenobacter sp. NBH84]|uniref:M61 family metallopeptidase n=1 Tax=Hymenobacter sp. NBH84 TaxID=2596915 RepID=UPI001629E8B8|nr:peptidase M61 [Hymenobacter sp. NBH84]QNE41195.1 peptidase M61 [Hymenobacter sp. NBH84]